MKLAPALIFLAIGIQGALAGAGDSGTFGGGLVKTTNSFNCGQLATYYFLMIVRPQEDLSLDLIREQYGEKKPQVSFSEIISTLSHFGVTAVGVQCDLNSLKNQGPFIAYVRSPVSGAPYEHFLVGEYRASRKSFLLVDLARSNRVIQMDDKGFESIYLSRAIILD